MIELIFVIVIIGILAAVAIPKLAATRDDAKASTAIANLATCIKDVGAAYTATQSEAEGQSGAACTAVTRDTCFTVTNANLTDGNLTTGNGASTATWCTDASSGARKIALDQNLSPTTHEFGGTQIVR
jgi:type II secretory pathway pseudopilin PulG